jgi:hypothetical protein
LLLSFFRLSDFERRSSGDLGCQGAPVSLALFFSGAFESFTPVPSDDNSLQDCGFTSNATSVTGRFTSRQTFFDVPTFLVFFLSGAGIRRSANPLRWYRHHTEFIRLIAYTVKQKKTGRHFSPAAFPLIGRRWRPDSHPAAARDRS